MRPKRLIAAWLCLLCLAGLADATPAAQVNRPAGDAQASNTVENLDRIVALCAADPGSPELTAAWRRYVAQNFEPGRDFSRTIEVVIDRASTRRQAGHEGSGALSWTAAERSVIRSNLQRTALVTIRELR